MLDSAERGTVRVAKAEFAAGAARTEQLPPEGAVEVAFAGRSNVGKSSLLNMLLARHSLARTSNTPGCTRQINFFDVAIAKGPSLTFVDLPGYGYAKVSKTEAFEWKSLLETYLHTRTTLRAIVVLVDVRRGLEAEEEALLGFLEGRGDIARIVAATKVDRIPLFQRKPRLVALKRESPFPVVATSASSSIGREELWGRILGAIAPPLAEPSG